MSDKMREAFESKYKPCEVTGVVFDEQVSAYMPLAVHYSLALSEKVEVINTHWITWQEAWQAAKSVPVGMRVSVDTSTGEHDAGNRVFAVVTGQQDDGRGGLILLCEEAGRNFEQSVPVAGTTLYAREQDLLAVGDEGATIFVSRTKPFTDWVPLYRAPQQKKEPRHD